MTKREVLKALENATYVSGIADVTCIINGKECSILVLLWGYGEDDSACDDDQIIPSEHWYICEGIDEFKEYLNTNQTKGTEFISVSEFISDFKSNIFLHRK